jgi:hypothetical protein
MSHSKVRQMLHAQGKDVEPASVTATKRCQPAFSIMAHDVVRLLSFGALNNQSQHCRTLHSAVDQIHAVQYEAAVYLLASQVPAYILLYDNGSRHNMRLASRPCSSLASCSCGASEACAHQPHAHPALHHCCSAVPAPQSSQAQAN